MSNPPKTSEQESTHIRYLERHGGTYLIRNNRRVCYEGKCCTEWSLTCLTWPPAPASMSLCWFSSCQIWRSSYSQMNANASINQYPHQFHCTYEEGFACCTLSGRRCLFSSLLSLQHLTNSTFKYFLYKQRFHSHVRLVIAPYFLDANIVLGINERLRRGIRLSQSHNAGNVLEVILVVHFDLQRGGTNVFHEAEGT